MDVEHMYAVIMAGGGGTRLWPVSRKESPKQLLPLLGQETLFQSTVDRLENLFPPERILVVTVAEQARQMQVQAPAIPVENYIIEPLPRGTGVQFASEVFGGSIPTQYIASVQKGVDDALARGQLAGFPVVDVRVVVTDGKSHPVDSKDVAFRTAGKFAVRDAFEKAREDLLLDPVDGGFETFALAARGLATRILARRKTVKRAHWRGAAFGNRRRLYRRLEILEWWELIAAFGKSRCAARTLHRLGGAETGSPAADPATLSKCAHTHPALC